MHIIALHAFSMEQAIYLSNVTNFLVQQSIQRVHMRLGLDFIHGQLIGFILLLLFLFLSLSLSFGIAGPNEIVVNVTIVLTLKLKLQLKC